MANEIIRPTLLPSRADPVATEVVPSDNGSSVAGVTWADGVNAAVPPASQPESEAGVINTKRMTPLTTKQAIDAQVPPKIGAAIGALNLGSASQAQVGDFATAVQGAKADSAVQPSRTVGTGTGLTGGGDLSANRTISMTPGAIASLSRADSSVQTVNGTPPDGSGDVIIDAEFLQEQNSVTTAMAESFAPTVEWVRTAGYSSAGDGGSALYKRALSEPSHSDKFQSADGAWWELVRDVIAGTVVGGQFDNEPYMGFLNGVHFGDNTNNSDPRGYSHGFYRRTLDTSLPYGNNIRAITFVNSAIDHVENVGYFSLLQNTADTATGSDLVGLVANAVKMPEAVGSTTGLWGGNILVSDKTARKSSVAGPGCTIRGLELNVSATGPDDWDQRIGNDVIMFHNMIDPTTPEPESIDGPTSHFCGQRVCTSSGFSTVHGDVTIKYAYISDPQPNNTGFGNIEVGYLAKSSQVAAFFASGDAPSAGVFRADVRGGSADIVMGTDVNDIGFTVASTSLFGRNSDDETVTYSNSLTYISDNWAGNESGAHRIQLMKVGTMTTVMELLGGSDNPLFVMIDGSLKQITAGAADSAGSGFRMLRIAN